MIFCCTGGLSGRSRGYFADAYQGSGGFSKHCGLSPGHEIVEISRGGSSGGEEVFKCQGSGRVILSRPDPTREKFPDPCEKALAFCFKIPISVLDAFLRWRHFCSGRRYSLTQTRRFFTVILVICNMTRYMFFLA